MPTLNWIGKDAVIDHHLKVPFHLLRDVPELACGEPGSGNLIVEGDNLVALKALLPYYAGQVKCIYIDPPYNTGNEKWIYNDNVNSPIIREWLGKVVGPEGETLDRHDRWLCMIYPRLSLLKNFLSEDGCIVVHIDEHEVANMITVLDEIYGRQNLVGQIAWDKGNPKGDAEGISYQHESILVYARKKTQFLQTHSVQEDKPNAVRMLKKAKHLFNRIGKLKVPDDLSDVAKKYSLPDEVVTPFKRRYTLEDANLDYQSWIGTQKDLKGGEKMYRFINADGYVYRLVSMAWPNKELAPVEYFRDVPHRVTGRPCAKPARGWRYPPDSMDDLIRQDRVWFGETEEIQPQRIYFLHENMRENATSVIKYAGADDDIMAQLDLEFPTLKPYELGVRLLSIYSNPGDIILDSFAGSGTAGHAVLQLNAECEVDERRKFILMEMLPEVARERTAVRLKRVAEGYTNSKGKVIEALGGSFRYCQLGEPLFTEDGKIRDSVTFADLARHVFFTETGEPLPNDEVKRSPFLGAVRGVGVYLLFNGILGDKSASGGNVLTRKILAELPPFDGHKVVYCAGCLLGQERLHAERITVRQTPYEIKVS